PQRPLLHSLAHQTRALRPRRRPEPDYDYDYDCDYEPNFPTRARARPEPFFSVLLVFLASWWFKFGPNAQRPTPRAYEPSVTSRHGPPQMTFRPAASAFRTASGLSAPGWSQTCRTPAAMTSSITRSVTGGGVMIDTASTG